MRLGGVGSESERVPRALALTLVDGAGQDADLARKTAGATSGEACTMHAHRMHNPCTKSVQEPAAAAGHLRHDSGSRRSKRKGRAPLLRVDPRLIIVTPEVVATRFGFLCRGWHRRCFQLSGMAIAVAGSFRFRAARTRGSPHRPAIGARWRSKPGPPGLNSARSGPVRQLAAGQRGAGAGGVLGAEAGLGGEVEDHRVGAEQEVEHEAEEFRVAPPGRGAPPARARSPRGRPPAPPAGRPARSARPGRLDRAGVHASAVHPGGPLNHSLTQSGLGSREV